jgi:hypothetical protein
MAKKPGSLFKTAETAEPAAPASAEQQQGPKRGKHLISGMFEPSAYRQFGVLAAELGKGKQALLQEALNDLFRKYGKPPIA